MGKLKSKVWVTILLAIIVILADIGITPQISDKHTAEASVESLPYYDFTNNTLMRASGLFPSGNDALFARATQEMRNQNGNSSWFGPLRYPRIYRGHVNDGATITSTNRSFMVRGGQHSGNSMVYIQAHEFPFIYVMGPIDPTYAKPNAPIHRTTTTTTRNIQLASMFNDSNIRTMFNGNPDYVFDTAREYVVENVGTGRRENTFLYIQDLANASGGEASNRHDPLNDTALEIYQTDYPRINRLTYSLDYNTLKVGDYFNFDIDGFEYVSNGLRGEVRNNVDINVRFTAGPNRGTELNAKVKSNKSQKDPTRKTMSRYTGKYTSDIGFRPTQAGTYTALLTVTDEVMRSTSKSITFTITDGEGGTYPDPKPDPDEEDDPDPDPVINTITIYHKDRDTGSTLRTNTYQVAEGTRYSYTPVARGTFSKGGNPYVASPTGQSFSGVAGTSNLTHTFWYRVVLPDPTEEGVKPGSTEGQSSGKAFWELRRSNPERLSDVYGSVSFNIAGNHFATRNIYQTLKLGDHSQQRSPNPITQTVNGASVKGKNMFYDFEYEYTNVYRDNYTCVSMQGSDCFEWRFVNRTAVWEKGKTFNLSSVLNTNISIDHRQEDEIEANEIGSLIVGRSDDVANNVKTSKGFYENLQTITDNLKNENSLTTQSTLNIKPDTLQYSVELPSGRHTGSSFQPLQKGWINGHYFPVEVDESLTEGFENNTGYPLGDHAFGLQQNELTDKGNVSGKRVFNFDFISDYFFITENTGYVDGYHYADAVKKHIADGQELPSLDDIVDQVQSKVNGNFLRQTGYEYGDSLLYIDTKQDLHELEKLQRYYIPVTPKSDLEPGEMYSNKIRVQNVGLNDVVWLYDQNFSFDHYLFGSAKDEAWLVEQSTSRLTNFSDEDVNTIYIGHNNKDKENIVNILLGRPTDRLHEFRVIDLNIVEKIRNIIGF